MPYLRLFLITCLLFSTQTVKLPAQWKQTSGPHSGTIKSFTAIGKNIFAGTSNYGVFLSTNNGTSWTDVSKGFPVGTTCFGLAVSDTNLFAGTNSGVYLSTNYGTSWTGVSNGLTNYQINTLIANGTTLLAGTNAGVFISSDNGTNWTQCYLGIPTNISVSAITIGYPYIFAGASDGKVYYTGNNGISWVCNTYSGITAGINSLVFDGTYLFAGTSKGAYRCFDHGRGPWEPINNNGKVLNFFSFAIVGSSIFGVGQDGVFQSFDKGAHWNSLSKNLPSTNVNCFFANETNLFAGTFRFGIYRCDIVHPQLEGWSPVNDGLTLADSDVRALTTDGTNIFAGTYDHGASISTDNGLSWTEINNGLTDSQISTIVSNGSNLLAGAASGNISLSSNQGSNWTKIKGVPQELYSLVFSGTNLIGGTTSGIWLSTNNGTNWAWINDGITGEPKTFAVNGSTLLAGTRGSGVFFSTNYGLSWKAINNGLINKYVYSIAINGMNYFAGTGNGVFLSTNNGTSWTSVSNGLPDYAYVNTLLCVGSNLFAGTSQGIYLSTNNGSIWMNVGNSSWNNLGITSLTVKGTNIFAGMSGSGVWFRSIDEMIPSNLYKIKGHLTYANQLNTPLGSSKVYLKNSVVILDSILTDSIGNYVFNNVSNGTYYLQVSISKPWGGVNSTDALLLRQYVTGLKTIDSLQLKASDVNLSGTVNSTDALLIRQRVVGVINSFVSGDWVHENAEVIINNSDVNQDLRCICTGDVNSSYLLNSSIKK